MLQELGELTTSMSKSQIKPDESTNLFESNRHYLVFHYLPDVSAPVSVTNLFRYMFVNSRVTIKYKVNSYFEWHTLRGLNQGKLICTPFHVQN